MKQASLGAENKPLDRAFGKLDGIGGGGGVGGGAPMPITLPRLIRVELFLTGIVLLPKKITNAPDSRLWQARGYNENSDNAILTEEY